MKAEIIEQAKDLEYALYATEDKSLILIATKVGAYLHESLSITVYNLTYLAAKIAPEPIYIRFVYDDTFNNNINDYNFTDLFIKQILPIFRHDENVIWQLIKKSSWKRIDSGNSPQPTIVDCFKNYRGYKWIPWPRWWAKKNNKRLKKFMDEYQKGTPDKDTVFLFDFVEY